ncbi:MAG: ATP-binding protein [Candidatus Diapherotrites archaeon]|uniref:ATP-binding protein n=1 Tax=Candidatus Iainarchaeum sp. TaxID=3101447 RepID=A0A8T3YL12_9ARCH|nr:ATP-binding protein [Candidatus Diapherotrites archaeon]
MSEKQGEEIGTVISSPEGPSPNSVDLIVNAGILHRGQFVEMDYAQGTLVCLVNNVLKSNKYFERFESVKEYESSGRKLFEQFPTHEWEYLVAMTRPLGVFSEGLVKRSTFPPSPGTKVRVAARETLEKFLGLDSEKGLHLGEIEHHNTLVKINLSRLLQKHLAILAMSGAGKSVLSAVIIEELLQRKKENGRIGVVVMDAHGEYRAFAEPVRDGKSVDFSSKTKFVRATDVQIGVPKLSIGLFAALIPGLSAPQKRDLARVIDKLRAEMKGGLGPFDFNAVKSEVLNDEDIKGATKDALIGWIMSLEQLGLFGKTDNPGIADLVRPGQLTVIDLSDVIELKKKQIIVAYYARKLFDERRRNKVPPFTLICEEAHQLAPENVSKEGSISKHVIETIAREGRKFGAGICLISQRPVNLSTTALSQCGTHIILRVTNPYDLDHIKQTSEGIDQRTLEMITSLRTGEGIIVGEAVNYPVFFKVRKKLSQDSGREATLEKAAVDFEESRDASRKDIEDLL